MEYLLAEHCVDELLICKDQNERTLATVYGHLGDKPMSDRRLGENLTGRQPTGRHILVNWATTLEECFKMHM